MEMVYLGFDGTLKILKYLAQILIISDLLRYSLWATSRLYPFLTPIPFYSNPPFIPFLSLTLFEKTG